jgi:hypothetical protein
MLYPYINPLGVYGDFGNDNDFLPEYGVCLTGKLQHLQL